MSDAVNALVLQTMLAETRVATGLPLVVQVLLLAVGVILVSKLLFS